jgi:hypothetical protein
MGWLPKNTAIENETGVNSALEAWRGTHRGQETLSPAARAKLFTRVTSPASAPFGTTTLFPPVRRWALGAGIPLVLTVGLAWLGGRVDRPEPVGVRIEAAKQGDDVVFTIADGRRVHQVRKSDNPTEFERAAAVRIRNGGSYRDGAEAGGDLVFYRID